MNDLEQTHKVNDISADLQRHAVISTGLNNKGTVTNLNLEEISLCFLQVLHKNTPCHE